MMREIRNHIVGGDPAPQLTIKAVDEPGAGGANHEYEVSTDADYWLRNLGDLIIHISFQNGSIKENGINGITLEALLAIVIDRLESFQGRGLPSTRGPFANIYNEEALINSRRALRALQRRTLDQNPYVVGQARVKAARQEADLQAARQEADLPQYVMRADDHHLTQAG